MRKSGIFLTALTGVLVLSVVGSFWLETGRAGQDRGVPAEELLEHTRESAGVPEDWAYAEDRTDTAYAVLFYDPEDPTDCTFRFCTAREGGRATSPAGAATSPRSGTTSPSIRSGALRIGRSCLRMGPVRRRSSSQTAQPQRSTRVRPLSCCSRTAGS